MVIRFYPRPGQPADAALSFEEMPQGFTGCTRSQTIFRMASIGTARGTPHTQSQNTSAKMTSTGFRGG